MDSLDKVSHTKPEECSITEWSVVELVVGLWLMSHNESYYVYSHSC